ncbi:MAG: ArsR family transcriptional regulator [Deltaproteobacteria bacterium]|nr:ArsR family transcriptional regulator [Deltaproteobacteria bacterium]
MQLFGEPTRLRLLVLLEANELTVAEITTVTELAQSRVSTHLGRLRDAGVLRDRKAGTATYYSFTEATLADDAKKLWHAARGALDDGHFASDRGRRDALIRSRAGAAWPEAFAGEMERHYSPGRTWEAYARGLLGLLSLGDVLDVGSGDGAIAQMLAPRSKSVTCIDRSEKMLVAAKARLEGQKNVRFQQGDAHELPFEEHTFDQVLLFNVLSYAHKPARAVSEAARVMKPGGKLVAVTLAAHDHSELVASYQHVNLGFTEAALTKLLKGAGLEVDHVGVVMREKREPHFHVLTAFAEKARARK